MVGSVSVIKSNQTLIPDLHGRLAFFEIQYTLEK